MSFPTVRLGSERIWTSLEPKEVEVLLYGWGTGTIDAGHFDIEGVHDGLAPRWQGTYESAEGGTYIEVHFAWDLSWIVGLVFGFMVLGPFALLFVLAIFRGFQQMQAVLDEHISRDLGMVERGMHAQRKGNRTGASKPTADPTSEGAAAGAPVRFAVRTTMDAAVFKVRGRGVVTSITVRRQGVTIERPDLTRTMEWAHIHSLHTDDGLLLFGLGAGTVLLDAKSHSPTDLEWLLQYLTTRNERWSPGADDRAAYAALSKLERERPRG